MNLYIPYKPGLGRFVITVLLPLISFFAGIMVPDLQAQANQAAGIVIYRSAALDGPEFYKGFVFKANRDTGPWLAFDVGQNRPIEIEKGMIVKILDFDIIGVGNVLTMDILSDEDVQKVTAHRDYIKSATLKMPKLETLVRSVTALLENQISSYNKGNIRMSGRWMDKSARNSELKSKAIAAINITIAGKAYTNPAYVSSNGDTVTLSHDAGIVKIPLKTISEKDKQLLVSTLKLEIGALEPAKVSPVAAMTESSDVEESPNLFSPPDLPHKLSPNLPSLPPVHKLPSIPNFPFMMKTNSIGDGVSEEDAIRDAQFKVVVATIKKHLTQDSEDWNSKITREKIGYGSTKVAEEFTKIAMKTEGDNVRVIIKTSIAREELVKLLLKLEIVEDTTISK
jgi:hypothetical protein